MNSTSRRYEDWIDLDEESDSAWISKPNRRRSARSPETRREARQRAGTVKKVGRVESRDGTFRCRNCKTIVGPPISGGRHRNHCPICLYSRHVDARRPGDRASDCRSMMEAVGVRARHNGEQELIHVCRGCGIERRNRIAADDNVVAVMRLPVISAVADAREDLGETVSAS